MPGNLSVDYFWSIVISSLYRINWNSERPRQIKQLSYRLAPLLLAAAVAVGGFLAAGNTVIRQTLNQTAMKAVSSRSLQVVDGYFLPLFQFISSASLWTRIGTIDSLGEPENYVDALYQNLRTMASVSALSMSDTSGRELVLQLSGEGSYQWRETSTEADDSLIVLRSSRRVNYLNLGDIEDISTSWGDIPVWFRFSTPYLLPGLNEIGCTIRASIGDRNSDFGINLWLDLPLSVMAGWLESLERFPGTVVFLLLPGGEFLTFPIDDLLALTAQNSNLMPDESRSLIPVDQDLIARVLRDSDVVEAEQRLETSFNYGGQDWRADYRRMSVGTQDVMIGTFIPVESLWTEDLFLPVQLGVSVIFGFVALLVILIIRDYRRNAVRQTEEELLRALIVTGESADLEFKSSLRWDYREEKQNKDLEGVILKSIAAFNNHEGGTLLIGVSDGGEILGLEHDYSCLKDYGKDYFELHLRNLVISQYGVSFATEGMEIRFFNIDGKQVCRVKIRKGKAPLYTTVAVKGSPPVEKFFVRSGNSSRAMDSVSEVTEYVIKRFARRLLG